MTTATLPRRFMRPVATAPARRSMLVGFLATLVAGLLLLVAISAAIGISAGSTVLRGVSVGGVELSGLERAAVAERLESSLPSLSSGQAVIEVDGAEETIGYAELGRGYEMEAMVDAAMAVGRNQNPLADGISRLRSLVNSTSLPVVVHAFDAEALDTVSRGVAARGSRHPVEAAVLRDGASFTVRPSEEGRAIEAATVSSALATALDTPNPADVRIVLQPVTVPPLIDTAMAERAAAAASGMAADLELTLPGGGEEEALAISGDTIAGWISFGPLAADQYVARLDEGAVASAVEALAADVNQDPVDAHIGVAAGGGLAGITPAQEGRELDVAETTTSVLTTLKDRAGGGSIATMGLTVNVTEPALTTAEAEAALPQMQLVSTWTTYYVPGDSNGFGNNINIPARDIDGRNLAPGEWFSFWDSIGPVTPERGYQYGGVIIGGRSVDGGAIGGGICSTSTTIFNAALRAGLEMGDRLNHHYYIDRYPDGLDATVFISDGVAQDMTFRNDTDNPIVIRGFGGNGFVTFELWTIPTGRTVAISDPVTSNHRLASDTTVVDSSMAPGTSRRAEFPHHGHDVTRTRVVYDAAGNEIHRNTYFSHYATVNGIIAVGPAAAASAPEPPADDGETAGGAGDAPPDEDE